MGRAAHQSLPPNCHRLGGEPTERGLASHCLRAVAYLWLAAAGRIAVLHSKDALLLALRHGFGNQKQNLRTRFPTKDGRYDRPTVAAGAPA